jgi:hypothetical protein
VGPLPLPLPGVRPWRPWPFRPAPAAARLQPLLACWRRRRRRPTPSARPSWPAWTRGRRCAVGRGPRKPGRRWERLEEVEVEAAGLLQRAGRWRPGRRRRPSRPRPCAGRASPRRREGRPPTAGGPCPLLPTVPAPDSAARGRPRRRPVAAVGPRNHRRPAGPASRRRRAARRSRHPPARRRTGRGLARPKTEGAWSVTNPGFCCFARQHHLNPTTTISQLSLLTITSPTPAPRAARARPQTGRTGRRHCPRLRAAAAGGRRPRPHPAGRARP